jgi:phosphoheptose isomerase
MNAIALHVQHALHVVSSLREGAELRNRVAHDCGQEIVQAASLMVHCLQSGGKLLFFGNGGSAAEAQHMELSLSADLCWNARGCQRLL